MENKVVKKCPICDEPYNFYEHFMIEQSSCPDCRRKADEKDRLNNTKKSFEEIKI